MNMTVTPEKPLLIHPLWLRLTHWLNAVAMLIMVTSGWRIYNASPLFNFSFINELTLGGWLGGALQWHFAGMWLFGLNGLCYLLLNLFSGRFKRQFWPLSPRLFISDLWAALRGKLQHADLRRYNMVQRVLYLLAMAGCVLMVLSGLVLWKSVQFPLLRTLLGGYEMARYIHFFAMTGLVGFVVIHLAMVVLVPRTLLAMLRGR
ncbi:MULTISPECIES: cytochrome b/b6 domain-containing protein [unclassified Serratia (in: enterobacteria)]|uniref:cytochrome b/b6 domain-containing protein n=1 Tax=unclassified Serratia (in: enterobacteria) TaxID=2647522 RepID=UPI000469C090|nr:MULTISPECIES: cytochrome b/b6 domain-containing protein [unclassified Serratia (in: enterobacteria)]